MSPSYLKTLSIPSPQKNSFRCPVHVQKCLPIFPYRKRLRLRPLQPTHDVPQGIGVMELAGIAIFFIYGTFVAGVGLQVGIGTALSLVVLDFVLSLITSQVILRIEG